jgi:chemotaxis protein MotB
MTERFETGKEGVMRTARLVALIALAALLLAGCSGNKKMLAQKDQQISDLEGDMQQLKGQLTTEKNRAAKLDEDLKRALADLEKNKKLCLEEKEGLTKITLPEAVTFASGSTRLTKEGKDILDRIWSVLGEYPDYNIMIEGHTDNVRIAEKFRTIYRTNWELSSARAHAVLHYLCTKYKADPARLAAVGYGEYRPIADNGTKEGRAQNRRVVIAVRKM